MKNFGPLFVYGVPAAGVLALLYAWYRASWINKQDAGNEKMQEISSAIREGAMAYLKRQYTVMGIFVVVVAGLLMVSYLLAKQGTPLWLTGVSFAFGAFCSALAGYFGMRVATAANVRTTQAARTGLSGALMVAFSGGSVMGMCVVGIGVVGLALVFTALCWQYGIGTIPMKEIILPIVTGFSLGASSIALFARVGGGIYTKSADVGADLVGKVEVGIPEDDPRNPAVIADNVGDNVGDVAGMGADLFESYIGALVGTMVLGVAITTMTSGQLEAITTAAVTDVEKAEVATKLAAIAAADQAASIKLILLPLYLAAVGIVMSILGTFFVRTKEGGNPQTALNTGSLGAAFFTAILTWPAVKYFAPQDGFVLYDVHYSSMGIFWATIAGLLAGVAIGFLAEYYTSGDKKPAQKIAAQSQTGAGTNIIAGLGTGMMSTALPVICLVIAIIMAYKFAGLYGIAVSAVGMLATLGIQLAVDAYGPIADNSGGIAEMAHLDPEVRKRTDKLDSVGNTTAAIGKGFAIGSAALTALALFAAYREQVGLKVLDLTDPMVMAGLFLGGMMPFLFSAFAMTAVGEAAFAMVEEVRRQFREIKGLMEGTARADYAKCVDIATRAAIKKMVVPGSLAVAVPVFVGFFFGKEMLGGLLAGVTVGGVMMAIFMANAGGAWDNAKKYIEGGQFGGKGSPAHKAAVIGDTVGDPFKDTAGPSLNILMKLMSVIALVLAPIFAKVTPIFANLLK
ncbi:MAG: sodium-translocating pyrophosphatase [Planctomycetota bacterium]